MGVVARFTKDGATDSSFNKTGVVTTDYNDTREVFNAVGLQSDGKIIAGGTIYSKYGIDGRMLAARYNTDGTLDETFGSSGYAYIKFKLDADGYDMVIQSNDKIVVSGATYKFAKAGTFDFALTRLTAEGNIDSAFGASGTQITDFGEDEAAYSILLQKDGNLIATGDKSAEEPAIVFARYYGDPVKQQGPLAKK